MNVFENFYKDLFNSPDFQRTAKINGVSTPCLVSQITTQEELTRYGIDEGISFYLRVRAKDYDPKKSDEVEYNGKKYLVDNFILDGQGLTNKVYLRNDNA